MCQTQCSTGFTVRPSVNTCFFSHARLGLDVTFMNSKQNRHKIILSKVKTMNYKVMERLTKYKTNLANKNKTDKT